MCNYSRHGTVTNDWYDASVVMRSRLELHLGPLNDQLWGRYTRGQPVLRNVDLYARQTVDKLPGLEQLLRLLEICNL